MLSEVVVDQTDSAPVGTEPAVSAADRWTKFMPYGQVGGATYEKEEETDDQLLELIGRTDQPVVQPPKSNPAFFNYSTKRLFTN